VAAAADGAADGGAGSGAGAGASAGAGDAGGLDGSFHITDWAGYPEGLPKPEGPFRLLEGEDYSAARRAADRANRAMHAADPSLDGLHLHEIQPVKFGGNPIDPGNKIPVTPSEHTPANTWWGKLQRDIGK
jgi:hypothetical protein